MEDYFRRLFFVLNFAMSKLNKVFVLMRSLTLWYKRNIVFLCISYCWFLRRGESFAHFNSDLEFLTN